MFHCVWYEGVDNFGSENMECRGVTRSLSGIHGDSLRIAARISNNSDWLFVSEQRGEWRFLSAGGDFGKSLLDEDVRPSEALSGISRDEFIEESFSAWMGPLEPLGYDLSRASILRLEWTFIFQSVHKRFCRLRRHVYVKSFLRGSFSSSSFGARCVTSNRVTLYYNTRQKNYYLSWISSIHNFSIKSQTGNYKQALYINFKFLIQDPNLI